MAVHGDFTRRLTMASPWRRRRMCILVSDAPSPAALRDISAAGAFVETVARPALGTAVELRHPEAGSIRAHVAGLSGDGVALSFDRGCAAVAFALTAIGADMSRRG
ncbi:hypothetical protein ACFB49_20850 [Sphingomonas sp. DBB INV C78]|uniref:hypothetical protein n=1 Tax=Sphingomonas sp. DBB INV C78 TaxID=3349434 RepID=UPI0036D32F8B